MLLFYFSQRRMRLIKRLLLLNNFSFRLVKVNVKVFFFINLFSPLLFFLSFSNYIPSFYPPFPSFPSLFYPEFPSFFFKINIIVCFPTPRRLKFGRIITYMFYLGTCKSVTLLQLTSISRSSARSAKTVARNGIPTF